jgi:uncharacterized membrane protein YeaQ/YmgE (transglycosylase-associated protein family)
MAELFFWAVLGALVGSCAKVVFWEERRESWPAVLLLGIGGALAGGFLRTGLGSPQSAGAVPHGFDILCMLLAISGAAVLLFGYHLWVERRPAVHTSGSIRRHAA